jgi:hypothetical protein
VVVGETLPDCGGADRGVCVDHRVDVVGSGGGSSGARGESSPTCREALNSSTGQTSDILETGTDSYRLAQSRAAQHG